jgi:DNA-binding CsgD family transcriptional regulator
MLSGRDLRRALEAVRRISDAAGPDELAAAAMRELSELVRCDYVSYVETNPGARRATAITDPGEAITRDAPEALARNLDDHPLVRYYATTGELRALKMSDFLTHREFLRTRLYDELFRPAETDYLLSAVLPMPRGIVVGFSLHRKRKDFSERDRALLDLLEPHLAQAYEQALLRSTVGALEAAWPGSQPGVVVLDHDMAALWTSPDVCSMLDRHFGPVPAGVLPRRLEDWLAAGCPGALVTTTDGRRLRVDPLGDRPAALLLTERPVRPSHASLRRLGLSRREAEVLSLVAEGKANAEIAGTLGVSGGTVKRHLEHVYEKLGVHTRTAAAAAAWAEHDATEPPALVGANPKPGTGDSTRV